MRRIRLYRWTRPDLPDGNFGDELSIPLLRLLFGVEAVPVPTHLAELLAAGSILAHHHDRVVRGWAPEESGDGTAIPPVLHVWGTGIVQDDKPADWPQRLEVAAVRGALTARHLGCQQAVLGDPGILASRMIDVPRAKQNAVAFVPHYVDASEARGFELPAGWRLVDPRLPVTAVLEAIAAADLVVSSSLHGLIVADGFGIPCIWAKTRRPLAGMPHLKFEDHATARRRGFGPPADYAELQMLKPAVLHDRATLPGRDVAAWQDALVAAFPFA